MYSVIAISWTTSDTIGTIGVAVSIIGFAIAVFQIRRTARAAEATAETLQRANRTQLLLLLPQFRMLELELDHAMEEDKRDLAARALHSYAYLADQVASVAETHNIANTGAVACFRDSASKARDAKGRIFSSTAKLPAVLKDFQESFNEAMRQSSSLSARLLATDKG